MDWSKIELNAKKQASYILKTRTSPIPPALPTYEPRGTENIIENSSRSVALESHSVMSKYTNLQGVVESHEELLRDYANKTHDSYYRLQSIEASQRVITERLDELQAWQEQYAKASAVKQSDSAEGLVTIRALLRRVESIEDSLRVSSQDVVTKSLFTQLVDTCMDQLSSLRNVTDVAQHQAQDALYHVETTLQAIAQLKNSKFGFQLDYLKGLSRDAQRSQLSLLLRDAIDGAIQKLFSERSEQADNEYRNELNAMKLEQQRFQKEMMSRFRTLEASMNDQTTDDARLEEVLVQVQKMQRKLDGEVRHTAASLAAMEGDIQLTMETHIRPLTSTSQQLQKEIKDLSRKVEENTRKVTSVDLLQDEMRRDIENNKTHTSAEINKLRRDIPNIDVQISRLDASMRVLEESMNTIQSEFASMDDLIVSVKAAGDTRVKAVQQLSDEVKTLKNEGCSLAKQCVSRLYALQSNEVAALPAAPPVRFDKVAPNNVPTVVEKRDKSKDVKELPSEVASPPSLASRVESLRRNVQSTIEKYEVIAPSKPALSVEVDHEEEPTKRHSTQSAGIILSPQKNITVGDIDESMSLSSDEESEESVCEPPADSPIPVLSKSAAQAAVSQPLVMNMPPVRALSDNDGVILSPSKNINPDDVDEAVSFQSSSDDEKSSDDDIRPETTPSPEQLHKPIEPSQPTATTRAQSPELSENEVSELFSFGDSLSKGTSNQLTHEQHAHETEEQERCENDEEDDKSCASSMSSDSFESEGDNVNEESQNMILPVVDSLGNLVVPGRQAPRESYSRHNTNPPSMSGSLLDSNRNSRGKPPSHLSALPWIGGGTPPTVHEAEEVAASPRPVSAPLPRSNTTGNMRPGASTAATAQCPYCLRRIVVQDMKAHQDGCELRPMLCKFGCGAKVIALKMEKHLDNCINNPDNKFEEDDDSFA